MYLIFDTETTGLPKNWNAPATNIHNWPRLVQIAWLIFDKLENQVESKNFIIRPDGFVIPPAATQVHGITMEKAQKEGDQLADVLQQFATDIKKSDILANLGIPNYLSEMKEKYKKTNILI